MISCFSPPLPGRWIRSYAPSQFITGRNEVVAKVMFLHMSVILFTGGVSRQCTPGSGRENPPGRQGEPPQTRQTPPSRENPPDQADPLGQAGTPPRQAGRTPQPGRPPGPGRKNPPRPGRENPPGIQSTSSRYASYWNAFLFFHAVFDKLCAPSVKSTEMFLFHF